MLFYNFKYFYAGFANSAHPGHRIRIDGRFDSLNNGFNIIL